MFDLLSVIFFLEKMWSPRNLPPIILGSEATIALEQSPLIYEIRKAGGWQKRRAMKLYMKESEESTIYVASVTTLVLDVRRLTLQQQQWWRRRQTVHPPRRYYLPWALLLTRDLQWRHDGDAWDAALHPPRCRAKIHVSSTLSPWFMENFLGASC